MGARKARRIPQTFTNDGGRRDASREFRTYCVDCGKRTAGYRRCQTCKAAWIEKYQAEGGDYKEDAYESYSAFGKDMVEV